MCDNERFPGAGCVIVGTQFRTQSISPSTATPNFELRDRGIEGRTPFNTTLTHAGVLYNSIPIQSC